MARHKSITETRFNKIDDIYDAAYKYNMVFGGPGSTIDLTPSIMEGHSQGICEGFNNDCENHATLAIQGETDSFGCEISAMCIDCYLLMMEMTIEDYVDLTGRTYRKGEDIPFPEKEDV